MVWPSCIALTKVSTLRTVFLASLIFLLVCVQSVWYVSRKRYSGWTAYSPGLTPLDEDEVAELLGRHSKRLEPTTALRPTVATSEPATTKELSPLMMVLQHLEAEQLSDTPPMSVLVRGAPNVVARDLPLFQQSFEKEGFSVHKSSLLTSLLDQKTAKNTSGTHAGHSESQWALLLCLAFSDGDSSSCMLRKVLPQLKRYQKISRIPGIRNTLWRKDAFCRTMMEARHLPALVASPISPLCWIMPHQYEAFAGVVEAFGEHRSWVFKSTSPGAGGGRIRVLSSEQPDQLKEMQSYKAQQAVVQQLVGSPLLVNSFHVTIRAYVLITSASPLRIFLHQEGLVYFRQDEEGSFKKIANRKWYFAQLRQYLNRHYGDGAEERAFLSIETAIVKTLLVAETPLAIYYGGMVPGRLKENLYKCTHCFQLLGVDLILNSTLHATIMEINGQPHMRESSKKDGWASNTIKATAIGEMVHLLFSRQRVAELLGEGLESMKSSVGLEDLACEKQDKGKLCLTTDDVRFLLTTLRQSKAKGNFVQIYPTTLGLLYDDLITDLSHSGKAKSPQALLLKGWAPTAQHSRWQDYRDTTSLHQLLTALERFYELKEFGDIRRLPDIAAPTSQEKKRGLINSAPSAEGTESAVREKKDDMLANLLDNVFGGAGPGEQPKCSTEPDTVPLLVTLRLVPGSLEPQFSPRETSYRAHVQHEVTFVRVIAYAAHCHSEIRIDHKMSKINRPTNWTLGVGENLIRVLVLSMEHSEPWVMNTYSVIVVREGLTDNEAPFNADEPHEVCYHPQECHLPVYQGTPCGTLRHSHLHWHAFLAQRSQLPACTNGSNSGHWVLPCTHCREQKTCFWREAVWLPAQCHYPAIQVDNLRKCMRAKKLLFIGDSTVRGMMFYLIEALNGTLYQWNKAHSMKTYNVLDSTSVSFVYYPQFWLAGKKQPVFDKAFHTLLKKGHSTLANNSDTVIVVGGVQWLSVHRLQVMQHALNKLGLQGATVVIKSFGSGFNQPIEGILFNDLKKHRSLVFRNRHLIALASQMGYRVVDTLSITLPRYKHFLYGRCACHFHTIKQSPAAKDRQVSDMDSTAPVDQTVYHVEGPVNALYSDIMNWLICKS